MSKRASKVGMTLVEVMVSVFLVAAAAAIVYSEMLVSYRILMRSRAKLEALGFAFDTIWHTYNLNIDDLPSVAEINLLSTPEDSLLGTNGIVKLVIRPENDLPTAPELINYWDIYVEVWPQEGSPMQVGTNSLAQYAVRRYRGER